MNSLHTRVEALLRGLLYLFVPLLVLAVWPGTGDPAGDIKLALLHWTSVVLGLAWVLFSWRTGVALKFPRLFGPAWLAFLAIYLLAALRSPFFDISFLAFSHFALLFTLYLLVAQLFHTEAHFRMLCWSVCAGVALAAGYGLLQWLNLDPFPWQDRESDVYRNLPSTFGHPNFAAHTLVLGLVMAAYLLVEGRLRRRETGAGIGVPGTVALILLMGLFGVHLLLTSQRGGLVALAAAALLLGAAMGTRRLGITPVKGALAAISALAGVAVLLAAMAIGLSKLVTGIPFPLDTSILIRYQSYVSAVNMLLERPLLGHGPAVYGLSYAQYWTPIEQQWFAEERMLNAHVHNDLMELGIDAGLFAAGLYLCVMLLGMGYGLTMALRASTPRRAVLGYAMAAFFCIFLVDGLFGFNLRVPVSATLLFLAAGALEGLRLPAFVPASAENRRFMAKPWRVAAVFFLPIMLTVQTRDFLSARDHHRGLEALGAGDRNAARQYFAAVVNRSPWEWDANRRLGVLSLAEGRLGEAAVYLDAALEGNPYYVLTLLSLAQTRMYLAQQNAERQPAEVARNVALFDDAEAHARRALELSPMDPAGLDLMGRISSLKAIALRNDSRPEAAQEARALWDQAEAHLEKAIEHAPNNRADVYNMLAEVRANKSDLPGAEEAFTRAIQAAPARPDLWDSFRAFARAHNRYDRLTSTLRAQLRRLEREQEPDREALATSHLGLGQVLAEGYADLEQADGHYRQAMTLASWRPDFWARFGEYVLAHQRQALMEQVVTQYMKSRETPGVSPALKQVALLARVLVNEEEELNAATTELVSLYQNSQDRILAGEHYNWLAMLLAQRLERASAPEALCTAHANLGILLNTMGKNDTAAPLLRRAAACVREETLRPLVAVHLGDALIQLQQPDQAMQVLREASQQFPENIDVRWAFARGLARIGLANDAKAAYKALIEEPWLDPRGKSVLQEELNRL